METAEKRQMKGFVKLKQLRVPVPSINFKYPLLIIVIIVGLLLLNSNEDEQEHESNQKDTIETFNEFVERVLMERGIGGETYILGNVSEMMQKMLQDSVQINFNAYHWRIGNGDILHINKNHGNFKKENLRGQINVTTKDYQKIYSIINSPDKIKLSESKHGIKSIKLSKYINAFEYIYIVTISKKKWQLTGKTLYIKKASVM